MIPDFGKLETVPEVVAERLREAQASKRPKGTNRRSEGTEGGHEHSSSLFETPDFGPDGGYKTPAEAAALLTRELDAFRALTREGSGRSHILAQSLGVLAGHGVPYMWSEEVAMQALMQACEENGFAAANGWQYAEQQARRGVEYGMQEPWHIKPEPVMPKPEDVPADAVEALLAEMRTPAQIKLMPRPKPLIKGLLSMDSESWLIGEPGSKKSFVALDMAAHVALGKDWQGRKVAQAPVVLIVAEGAGGIGDRIAAWESLYGPMPDCVHILPRPVQAKDMQAWAVLVEACRRIGPGMVVVDTQARVTVGLEENSATEIGIYIEAVRATREATGACVLTVHHTGRRGGDARGSSAIDGAQTTELKVTSEGLSGTLTTEKQKDMAQAPPIPLKFQSIAVGVDEDGEDVTSLALVADAFRRAAGEERPEDEPEEWEKHHGAVQVQILKVLRDHAGAVGLTEEKVRSIVAERFWGGQYHKTTKGALRPSTWASAWTKCREKVAPVSGDAVMVSSGGARYALDSLAFEELTKASGEGS